MNGTRPKRRLRLQRAAILAFFAGLAAITIADDLPKTTTVNRAVAIKSGKSSLAPILSTVEANTTLTILGKEKSFIQVQTADGTKGYIMEDDLPRALIAPKEGSSVPRTAAYGGAGRGLQDEAVNYAAEKKITKKTVAAVDNLKSLEDQVTDESLQTFAGKHHLGPKQYRAH